MIFTTATSRLPDSTRAPPRRSTADRSGSAPNPALSRSDSGPNPPSLLSGSTSWVKVEPDWIDGRRSADLFSIVIPLYNKAHTVVGTIESVLDQTFQEFEIVVVDDGSTDDGAKIIARHFTDPRIRIVTQEQRGPGPARNRGVEEAVHELIAFLDADDLWLSDFLMTMKKAVDEFPDAGTYCCGGVSRNPDGSGYIRSLRRFGEESQEVDFLSYPWFFTNASSIVVRKSIFTFVGGFPDHWKYGEDSLLFFKLAISSKIVFSPAVLTVYEHGVEGQITSGDTMRHHLAVVERSSTVYDLWASSGRGIRDPSFIRITMRDLRRSMLEFIRKGDYNLVRHFFDSTDERLLARLTAIEKRMYKNPKLRWPAMSWIYVCELAWRVGRPPRPRYSKSLDRSLRKRLPPLRHEVRQCEKRPINRPCGPLPSDH